MYSEELQKKICRRNKGGKPHIENLRLCGSGEELNVSFPQKSGLAKGPVMKVNKRPLDETISLLFSGKSTGKRIHMCA